MHSPAVLARLKNNKLAYNHFEKTQKTYLRYAKEVLEFTSKYPALTPESRAFIVKRMILEMEPNIWGLANVNMTAEEVADCFARLVVGHET
jgi:hypothetical protein